MAKTAAQHDISALAKEFGVSGRTLRYYEERGLLAPVRTAGNVRKFSNGDRTRLRLILRGKALGLSLDEITTILGPADHPAEEPEQLQRALAVGQRYLAQVRQQIATLQAMEAELQHHGRAIAARMKRIGIKKRPVAR